MPLAGPGAGNGCSFAFADTHAFDLNRPERVQVGLPLLTDGSGEERWLEGRNLAPGRRGDIGFMADDELLCGHLLVEEGRRGSLQALGEDAYRRILAAIDAEGFPHLLRIWHVLPGITETAGGLERYRSFSVGRHRALAAGEGFERTLPAASAVGSQAPGVLVSFLAGRRPGRQVENPRQVSAFRYPERYGPKSPSFSRALRYADGAGVAWLLVSGTASIVGHETQHAGDVLAQTDETLRNLAALGLARGGAVTPMRLRAYVRHAEAWPDVERRLRRAFGPDLPLVALVAGICRDDLAVEIEAVGTEGLATT